MFFFSSIRVAARIIHTITQLNCWYIIFVFSDYWRQLKGIRYPHILNSSIDKDFIIFWLFFRCICTLFSSSIEEKVSIVTWHVNQLWVFLLFKSYHTNRNIEEYKLHLFYIYLQSQPFRNDDQHPNNFLSVCLCLVWMPAA